MTDTRIERDPLGEKAVPASALYGIQTLRAAENFPISGLRPLPAFVDAVVQIKRAAALTHKETGRLEPRLADAITAAAVEVLEGRHRDQFVVDPYQAGAGTSHNMNCNEVLANRANELLGEPRGSYAPVHPNDHVNMAQSTNDVIPTAIQVNWRVKKYVSSPNSLWAITTPGNAARAEPTHFPHSMVANDRFFSKSRPMRLGVKTRTSPASAIAIGVNPARTVPSARGSYQIWFSMS